MSWVAPFYTTPKTEVVRDREIETNVPDSDVIAETKTVSEMPEETQEETRNAPAKKMHLLETPQEKNCDQITFSNNEPTCFWHKQTR